ncbi:hypothetical protein KKE92_05175 [Candidatus Micrarchaeota archaeon]|nr:hypothetical protein [Candidatus Micrarchaeota archaeon]MBU1681836.1 hypothetical protein [Candidatus Micrarchaeota archaeon]
MFEGESHCCICKNQPEKQVFKLTISGYSKTFCQKCLSERDKEVSKILLEHRD